MKKALALALFAMIAAPMFASVELNTSISDVYHRGTSELAGSITMNVTDDDFREASTTTPVYIRVTPDHNSRLADTLVNQALPALDYRSNPIYLAMKLRGGGAAVDIVASTETVSIVRWVENESSLWLRVQQSSDVWLDAGGVLTGPSVDLEVSWTFGVSARLSDERNLQTAAEDASNLPFNTRDITAIEGDFEDATSTLICVDLSGSNLADDGTDEARLDYDIIALDENADIGGGNYSRQAGNDTGINFTNDFTIARGKSRACTVREYIPNKTDLPTASLCIDRAAANGSADEFVTLENWLTIQVDCESGGTYLSTELVDGAYVHFNTNGNGNYGFWSSNLPYYAFRGVGDIAVGAQSSAVVAGSNFLNHGRTLYTQSTITYEGATVNLDTAKRLSMRVPVQQHYTDAPITATVDWTLVLVSHTGEEDDAPYDGVDQHRRCAPSEFEVGGDTFTIGDFVDCAGTPVSLFFPYLPRLVGNSDFWVGLSYVNQGGVNLDVTAHIYDEDGNLFAADLGSVDSREQRTWAFSDLAGQATFTGAGANNAGESIVPVPADPNVDPASVGTTRSSMFIVGTFFAEFNDELNAGDLDGYLLVGNASTNSIDGAYLPRNWDVGGGQAADLPLFRSKK